MPLNVSDTGSGDYQKVPQGTHIAVCNMVVDLGMQETSFGTKHQLYLRFETPHERMEYEKDGQTVDMPMSIGNFYTASLSDKANLRHDLEAWRGRAFTPEELKGFDVFNVLGVPCQITVTHREKGGKTYANITGITSLAKGMEKPQAENPLLKYSADEPGDFDKLPDWLKNKIDTQVKNDEPPVDDAPPFEDDDIPGFNEEPAF